MVLEYLKQRISPIRDEKYTSASSRSRSHKSLFHGYGLPRGELANGGALWLSMGLLEANLT